MSGVKFDEKANKRETIATKLFLLLMSEPNKRVATVLYDIHRNGASITGSSDEKVEEVIDYLLKLRIQNDERIRREGW